MNTDLALVTGVVMALLAVPSVISAFAEGRPPRSAAVLVMIGGALVLYALYNNPAGYRAGDFPRVVMRVWADLIH